MPALIVHVIADEVTDLCGPKHCPAEGSEFRRAGSYRGKAYFDGEWMEVKRPRVGRKTATGEAEARLTSYLGIKDPFEEATRADLRFFPPYSPNLNPIERLWRFMMKTACHNRYHEALGESRGALLEFFARLADKYRGQLESSPRIPTSSTQRK